MFRYALLFCLLLSSIGLWAQIGTQGSYRFLQLTQSPREAALGGKAAFRTGEIGFALSNPALLDSSMHKNLLFQYTPYTAGINYGNVQYVFGTKSGKSFGLGVQSFSYGKFTQADATGQIIGEVSASDFALYAGHSLKLADRLSMGMNLKFIFSNLYSYQSLGFSTDIAFHYTGKKESFQSSLLVRNIGLQLIAYPGAEREGLPFEVQLGVSKQIAKAPFTLFAAADNLQKWDLAYEDAELNRSGTKEQLFTFDKLFRHISAGIEFSPSDKFVLRTGYNYMRQQELRIINRNSLSGFSFGLGFQLGRYRVEYSLVNYHLAGVSNHLSVHTNLGSMKKNRKS